MRFLFLHCLHQAKPTKYLSNLRSIAFDVAVSSLCNWKPEVIGVKAEDSVCIWQQSLGYLFKYSKTAGDDYSASQISTVFPPLTIWLLQKELIVLPPANPSAGTRHLPILSPSEMPLWNPAKAPYIPDAQVIWQLYPPFTWELQDHKLPPSWAKTNPAREIKTKLQNDSEKGLEN